ncbi:MAG: HEAT repeat domain-containing protein [Polyangiales bacterium]
MSSPADTLTALFDADRALLAHERALLATPSAALCALLAQAVAEAKTLADSKEAAMRLQRLSDLCAQVEGPEMTDALIAILDHEEPGVRVQAAEALVDVGFERYAEVARGIERALSRGEQGKALRELPWVLCEIAEPSARPLIARFLRHADPEIVASAVEALAELGEAEAVKDLQPLRDDPRHISIDDDESEIEATLGELVRETIDALQDEP